MRWTLGASSAAILRVSGDDARETADEIEELRLALAARNEFLAAVAHELRNPLTALSIRVQHIIIAARRGNGVDELLPLLSGLHRQVDRYVGRATTLLEVSRLSARELDLDLVPVDASEVVRGVVADLADQVARSGGAVHIAAPRLMVHADRDALAQIVENLVSNALKHGGGTPVTIELARRGGNVELTVRDRGPGISEEDQSRIFAAFERVMAARRSGGFGVGLWVVRRLVDAMRGSIHVATTPGDGASFTVALPAIPDEDGGR